MEKWINLTPNAPIESDFASTRGQGTPVVINGNTNEPFYLSSNNAITPLKTAPRTYITVDDLSAVNNPDEGDGAILAAPGREGLFIFDSNDLSAFVTVDTEQGVFIASDDDPTGATGAWKRVGVITPQHFGAIDDDATDSNIALQAYLDFLEIFDYSNLWQGKFRTSVGLIYDGVSTGARTLNIEGTLTASVGSTIEKLLTIKNANHLVIGTLKLVGRGSSAYSGRTTGTGLWLETVGRCKFKKIRAENFWNRAVFAYDNCNFSEFGSISANDCGSGIKRATDPAASLTETWTYNVQNGGANSVSQSTTLDVSGFYPSELDTYIANPADAPIYVRIYDQTTAYVGVYKITAINRVGGTINVHPWINPIYTNGELDFIFGGGFQTRGSDVNAYSADCIETIRCGNAIACASLGGGNIRVVSCAYSGIGIIIANGVGSAQVAGSVGLVYFEPSSNEVQIMFAGQLSASNYWQLHDEIGLEPENVKVLGPVDGAYNYTKQLSDMNYGALTWNGARLQFEKGGTGYLNAETSSTVNIFDKRHGHIALQRNSFTVTTDIPDLNLNRLFGYSGATYRFMGTGSGGKPTGNITVVAPVGYTVNGGATAVFSGFYGSVDIAVELVPGSTDLHARPMAGYMPDDALTYSKLQNVSATARFLGRITAGAGDIEELTGTQATTLLDAFTTGLKGLAPASGGGITNFLRADGSWTTPSSSDPWTTVVLGSDFTTTSATIVDVTGLAFTPAANTIYEIEGKLLVSSSVAADGIHIGVDFPGGLTTGAAKITVPITVTTQSMRNVPVSGGTATPTSAVAADENYLSIISALVNAGAVPGGDIKVRAKTEVAGTTLTIRTGSFIRYREVV